MRQIFSLRFLAAIGATVGLFAVLTLVFVGRDSTVDVNAVDNGHIRRIDIVAAVQTPELADFALEDGIVRGSGDLVLSDGRVVRLVEGTHGEITCERFRIASECAVLVELLGDAVIWFALVPVSPTGEVVLPAIDTLERGRAVLVNGWSLPYASRLERRCDREFASYREFRDELGTAFSAVHSIDDGEIVAVVCDT